MTFQFFTDSLIESLWRGAERGRDRRPPLRAAVERDLAAVHDGLDMAPAPPEAPAPPPELTDTYAVAFASAVRHCPHENSHSTLYARRERQCDDCGRYFTRKEWWDR